MSTRAERVREARKGAGFDSQQQLADAINRLGAKPLTRGAVGNWERGGGITRDNLAQIEQVTGYRAEYIDRGTLPKISGAPLSAARIETAGYRLKAAREAICKDLPLKIGISSEIAWDALINQPGGLHPQIAQQIADVTGLPLSYIEDGDTADLTRDQAAALLDQALRDHAATS